MYNKRTQNWFVVPVKEPKLYEYIPELQLKVLQMRETVKGPLQQKAVLAEDDPRRISRTIARTEPPSVAALIERHVSRNPKT